MRGKGSKSISDEGSAKQKCGQIWSVGCKVGSLPVDRFQGIFWISGRDPASEQLLVGARSRWKGKNQADTRRGAVCLACRAMRLPPTPVITVVSLVPL